MKNGVHDSQIRLRTYRMRLKAARQELKEYLYAWGQALSYIT